MEWISVNDKIPQEGTRVNVYHTDGVVRIGMVINGRFGSVLNKDLERADVTHWMPLPEPPKDA